MSKQIRVPVLGITITVGPAMTLHTAEVLAKHNGTSVGQMVKNTKKAGQTEVRMGNQRKNAALLELEAAKDQIAEGQEAVDAANAVQAVQGK